MGFEESLIRYSAPTLAGIKVANLYNYCFRDVKSCTDTVNKMNHRLNTKGIYIEPLRGRNGRILLYVYRRNQLKKILRDPSNREFLRAYGYDFSLKPELFIQRLRERINASDGFPHEIGIFLGYPLADVEGFIVNKGAEYLIRGEWKVYHNPAAAINFFRELKKCSEIYLEAFSRGRSIYELTACL